jgi:hypothetical protein
MLSPTWNADKLSCSKTFHVKGAQPYGMSSLTPVTSQVLLRLSFQQTDYLIFVLNDFFQVRNFFFQ